MEGDPFTTRCSEAPFSEDELEILQPYGWELERVSSGERALTTTAQAQFVDAARGRLLPETVYERVWTKYLTRLEWESDPANRERRGRPDGCRTTARTGNACAEQLGTTLDDGHGDWMN